MLRPGAFADLALLDLKRVADRASYLFPRREATGTHMVVINGRVAFENGSIKATGCGKAIR